MAESLALKGMPKEDKLNLILDMSLRCLAQNGYSKTTMDIIAEQVGVSKGTLSYYFNNKEELIAAALDYAGNGILSRFNEAIGGYDTPAEKVHAGLTMLWSEFSANHAVIRVYYDLFAQGLFTERLRLLLAKITGKFRDAFMVLLQTSKNGSVPENNGYTLIKAAMLGSLVDGIVKQMIIDPEAFAGHDLQAGIEKLFQKICDSI